MILAIGFLRYGYGTITCYKQQPGGPQDAGTGGKQANRVRYFVSHYLWAVRNGHIMSSCHETTRSSLGAMETYYSHVNPCQDYEKVLWSFSCPWSKKDWKASFYTFKHIRWGVLLTVFRSKYHRNFRFQVLFNSVLKCWVTHSCNISRAAKWSD